MRSWLGAALFWAAVAVAALTVGLLVGGRGGVFDASVAVLVGVGMAGVARVLTARRPENRVGYLLATIALLFVTAIACDSYSARADPSDPEAALTFAVCFGQQIWSVWLLAAVGIALPLLFPDGELPSRRWRVVAWAGVVGTAIGSFVLLIEPGLIENNSGAKVLNPFGIEAAEGLASAGGAIASVLTGFATIAAVASVVVRLRRARGIERQQVKWFAYVVIVIVAGFAVAIVASEFVVGHNWAYYTAVTGWFTALIMGAFGMPAATAIAVLRYRLYDVDVVINRTLVYAALTLSLLAAYLGAVLLLQLALGPLTEDNGLAIAGSTLAVAALFRPLRGRIQQGVDHRFYRRKYDAGRTIERFGARLREEVSLDSLSSELREVVTETMQPAHVSVWLRAER